MVAPWVIPAVSAGLDFASNFIGNKKNRDAEIFARQQSEIQQQQWNWNADFQREIWNYNADRGFREEDYRNRQLQYRVADARAAGIHPLAALGINPAGPMGSVAGAYPVDPQSAVTPGGSNGYSRNMGQSLGRAARALATAFDRDARRSSELNVERQELENDYLRARIATEQQQSAPPVPIQKTERDNVSPLVDLQRMQVPATDPGRPDKEAYQLPDFQYVRTPTGFAVVPSGGAKERTEDMWGPSLAWQYRNLFLPMLGNDETKPNWIPSGKDPKKGRWRWNVFKTEWQWHDKTIHRRFQDNKFGGR